jgi:hypothetical protein
MIVDTSHLWNDFLSLRFPKSAQVDMSLYLAAQKSLMRFPHRGSKQLQKIDIWCNKYGFTYVFDESYIIIGSNMMQCKEAIALDSSPENHTYHLGILLGYPSCCSIFAKIHHEEDLDVIEVSRIGLYEKKYKLIDTCGYMNGHALISHLPCKTDCNASYQIALKMLSFMKKLAEKNPSIQWFKKQIDLFNIYR